MANPGPVAFSIDRTPALETSRTLAHEIQQYHSAYDGASCREVNTTRNMQPDWIDFEPAQGESTAPAKFVCGRCVHQDHCLKDALDRKDSQFIWGGTSAKERKSIVKAYYNELKAGTISPSMTIGEFGILAREFFVTTPKPKARKTSYPPKVVRNAQCQTDAIDIFNELESTRFADLSRDLVATAVASCLNCLNLNISCVSTGVKSASGVTVVDGEILGRLPKRLVPPKRLISQKLDLLRTPDKKTA